MQQKWQFECFLPPQNGLRTLSVNFLAFHFIDDVMYSTSVAWNSIALTVTQNIIFVQICGLSSYMYIGFVFISQ